MTDETTMKFTDFDSVTGDHHLQMLKAALPYVNIPQQRFLSIFVKFQELRRTISLFDEEETAVLGICSLGESASRSPLDMLEAIKPYGTPQEQDFLDMLCSLLQGIQLGNQYQEMKMQESRTPPSTDNGAANPSPALRRSPIEQIKAFLPAEQQNRLDTVTMMMQAMQQLT